MTMFCMFKKLFNLTCLELYIITVETLTQTCAHLPPYFASSLNLEGLDEYLNKKMNLESSFEENPRNYLIFILLLNDL